MSDKILHPVKMKILFLFSCFLLFVAVALLFNNLLCLFFVAKIRCVFVCVFNCGAKIGIIKICFRIYKQWSVSFIYQSKSFWLCILVFAFAIAFNRLSFGFLYLITWNRFTQLQSLSFSRFVVFIFHFFFHRNMIREFPI